MSILLVSLFVLLVAVLLVFVVKRRAKSFGSLVEKKIYQDTEKTPGTILYAKSLPLCGKPDYLIKQNGMIIPVEVKTGKTPASAHLNHTMQLMAYCYLVEETYGIRPPGGILKYPDQEYRLAYDDKAKKSVKLLVKEITQAKKLGKEFRCTHPNHNTLL